MPSLAPLLNPGGKAENQAKTDTVGGMTLAINDQGRYCSRMAEIAVL